MDRRLEALKNVQAEGGGEVKSNFEPGDQMDSVDIICPHCGHSRQAEPCDGDGDEDPKEEECYECGKKYLHWAYITIDYCTSKVEDSK